MGDNASDTSAAGPSETPWALAQRLAEHGLPLPALRDRLLQAGLPSDDVATLLRALSLKSVAAPSERGPAQEPNTMDVLVGVAKAGLSAHVMLTQGSLDAGKVMLSDMLQVTTSFMGGGPGDTSVAPVQPMTASSEQAPVEVAPFEVADGSPRCRVHPRLPAVDLCPRCGVSTCYTCARKKGFGGTEFCTACEQHPQVRAARVKKASRWLAAAILLEAGVLLGLGLAAPLLGTLEEAGFSIPSEVVLSLPFGLLGLMQGFVRHPWPGVVGAAGSGGVMLAILFGAQDEVPPELLVALVAPLAIMLFALERLTARRKVQRAPRGAKAA